MFRKDENGSNNRFGKRVATFGKQQPTDGPTYSVGCLGRENLQFLKLKIDASKEEGLLFLVDTGADVSLLKGSKLVGTTEFNPEG